MLSPSKATLPPGPNPSAPGHRPVKDPPRPKRVVRRKRLTKYMSYEVTNLAS
jgi:hypothetical protein